MEHHCPETIDFWSDSRSMECILLKLKTIKFAIQFHFDITMSKTTNRYYLNNNDLINKWKNTSRTIYQNIRNLHEKGRNLIFNTHRESEVRSDVWKRIIPRLIVYSDVQLKRSKECFVSCFHENSTRPLSEPGL